MPRQAFREFRELAVCYTVSRMNMKTVEEVRRENLARLVAEAGGVARLAERLGRSPSQISQWLNASLDSKTKKPRTISGRSARLIEARVGKAKGWMDQDHTCQPTVPVADQSDIEREVEELLPAATPRSRGALRRIAQAARNGRLKDEDLELLEQIAERLSKR